MDTTANTAGSPSRSKGVLRVFLVEDLPGVRDLVVESLAEIEGLELSGFTDTEDGALQWLGGHDCDILILDLELKRGNGMGVLRALAGAGRRPPPLRIVYSNHVSASIRKLAQNFGAEYFFDKTLDTPALWTLLQRLSAAQG